MLACHCFPGSAALHGAIETALGSGGILLPIVAVAALSLAASFDLEARVHTYAEMLAFLKTQKDALQAAESERSFGKFALETETRLLGETASWYSRRAFTWWHKCPQPRQCRGKLGGGPKHLSMRLSA